VGQLGAAGGEAGDRQKLALITFAEKVKQAQRKIIEEGADPEYAKTVVTYLGLIMSRTTDYSSTYCSGIMFGNLLTTCLPDSLFLWCGTTQN